MKIILSRKGLDSQYGGIPSPIIKSVDGHFRFCPIPIPEAGANVKYVDLNLLDGHKISEFLIDVPLKSMSEQTCHLDPDIRESYLSERPEGWQKAFGQSHIAQDHLRRQGVGVGDVFLFFGWFQFAELMDNNHFRFKKDSHYPNGFHAIYGYMQVEKIYDLKLKVSIPEWLKGHPHVKYESLDFYNKKSNFIYTAGQYFKYQDQRTEKKGSALFDFSEDLILTRNDQGNRSYWELPGIFHPEKGVELSYNPEKNWGKLTNGKAFIRTARKGQEFVVKTDPNREVERWCIDLILGHVVTD